jgi:8-oxo-dGTP pyrophosphatase MutT (NUDIX family)
MNSNNIHVVAVLVQDHDDNILLVRKRGTETFIQPGGKPEHGESIAETAQREVLEETGLNFDTNRFKTIGTFDAPAANEPGFTITADCLRVRLRPGESAKVLADAEIEQLAWFTPRQAAEDINAAPLFKDIILPMILDTDEDVVPQAEALASVAELGDGQEDPPQSEGEQPGDKTRAA